MKVTNYTKLLSGGIEELAVQAAKLLRTHSVNVIVRYREGQRGDCRYKVESLGLVVTLFVRPPGSRPYGPDFLRSVAANIRAGTAKLRHRRGSKVFWLPTPPGVRLWRVSEVKPKAALPRKVQNSIKAHKALERCMAAEAATYDRLERLKRRHNKLAARVRYYEKVLATEGPEFEAKLKAMVKEKWGEPEAELEEPADDGSRLCGDQKAAEEAEWDEKEVPQGT